MLRGGQRRADGELFGQGGTVGQPGHEVVMGQVVNAGLGLLAL